MNTRIPPRYLPTLTEVVDPSLLPQVQPAPVAEPVPEAEREPAHLQGSEIDLDLVVPELDLPAQTSAAVEPELPPDVALAPPVVVPAVPSPPIPYAPPDRQALAQQLIRLVKPQLEAELRSLALELFEAQFSALLPSMHLHIEEAVREALEQALPEVPSSRLPS